MALPAASASGIWARRCGVVGAHPLRLGAYNLQSACQTGRLNQVAAEMGCDILGLSGLCWRAPRDRAYQKLNLGKGFWALVWGWRPSPFTNKSAGVALVFGRRIKEKKVRRIFSPPAVLTGRVGAVRIKRASWI